MAKCIIPSWVTSVQLPEHKYSRSELQQLRISDCTWLREDLDSDSDAEHERGQGYDRLMKSGQRFISCWNGPLWVGPACIHYQAYDDARSREEIAVEMVDSAQHFLFSAVPTVPEANKWTKLGPCADWISMALCIHGLLGGLFAQLKATHKYLHIFT